MHGDELFIADGCRWWGNAAVVKQMNKPTKNPAAVSLGRLGGLAQGWQKMTPQARQERAKKAVAARIKKLGQKTNPPKD